MFEIDGKAPTPAPDTSPIGRYLAAALSSRCGLEGEARSLFRQTVAELGAALHQGHSCLMLDRETARVLGSSPLVGIERPAPLVISGERLYFGRYYRYESGLAESLARRAAAAEPAAAANAPAHAPAALEDDPDQRRALEIALRKKFCIISGGPGTGKTTLIVAIIARLLASCGGGLRIGLAAPTGKAAMRMQESLRVQLGRAGLDPLATAGFPERAMTLHRLLGIGRFAPQPKHHRGDPLNYDVVLVDEASMIDLAMMWRLVEAIGDEARLILLGDRDQLASVESGAVLADCIDALPEHVAVLRRSYRFSSAIGRLAAAVQAGDGDGGWDIVRRSAGQGVFLAGADWQDQAAGRYRRYLEQAATATDAGDYPALFGEFKRFRILCALRRGGLGVEALNRRLETLFSGRAAALPEEAWYPGRPVIVMKNDHSLGLFNGDIGICLPAPDAGRRLRVWFESAEGGLKHYPLGQIPPHEPAWALTVHRAQGSEFERVVVVLPDGDSPILCRELLYTALTRAREQLTLVCSEEVWKIAAARRTARHSGLAERLARLVRN